MKFTRVFGWIAIAVFGLLALGLATALLVYPHEYVYRVLVWQESDALDWQKFPAHALKPAPQAHHFAAAPDARVKQQFEQLSGAQDWNAFLAANGTQAFIVIKDGAVLYENYFNGAQRDSIVTSFSVAKSVGSALIGMALQEGYIKSINDPITAYLPELALRDRRFTDITIRHVLLMASGLEYQAFRPLLFNSDDVLTTYFPDQRRIALENTRIAEPPGQHFRYNKYHPQLLGMLIERTTGMSVTQYLQTRLWDRIGMEFGGSWSIDSETSNFEKMETGLNARAIDFAKFGVLFLNGGRWQGNQVIAKDWVEQSTQPPLHKVHANYYTPWFATLPGQAYYQYMWWGMRREGGSYDFTAEGDKGQFIYVSPQKGLVIVRNGVQYGMPSQKWLALLYAFSSRFLLMQI